MKRTFTLNLWHRAYIALFCLICVIFTSSPTKAYAQDDEIFSLKFDARIDWVHEALDGNKVDEKSGFKGKYVDFQIDGRISPKFNYSYRQRLNRAHKDETFFDATDWLWINYTPTENWSISAGKQVVLIGGWEYDRSPIDIYFGSEYWNNIGCYQLGASVTYTTNNKSNAITFQACQSPFDTSDTDLYAFNLFWSVGKGCYKGLHSVNASQYANGKYIWYVALGNQFTWGDARLQLDFMERDANGSQIFDDFSVMGEFSYLIADRVNILGRATYDKCNSSFPRLADLTVYPGSELTRVGGGVEYYPLGGKGNRSLRLHAVYYHTFGDNSNPNGTAIGTQSVFTAGVTWKFDVLNFAKKLINKCKNE